VQLAGIGVHAPGKSDFRRCCALHVVNLAQGDGVGRSAQLLKARVWA
jgi:hypothetical protein